MYALGGSSRVIDAVRTAAKGFAAIGATVDPTDEVWEGFIPSYMVTSRAFVEIVMPFDVPKPSAEELEPALAVRQRNWRGLRATLADYDLLLSPTAQLTAPRLLRTRSDDSARHVAAFQRSYPCPEQPAVS